MCVCVIVYVYKCSILYKRIAHANTHTTVIACGVLPVLRSLPALLLNSDAGSVINSLRRDRRHMHRCGAVFAGVRASVLSVCVCVSCVIVCVCEVYVCGVVVVSVLPSPFLPLSLIPIFVRLDNVALLVNPTETNTTPACSHSDCTAASPRRRRVDVQRVLR